MPNFRRFTKTATLSATGLFGDDPLALADYVLRLLRVTILIALWRVVLAGRAGASGMTAGAILTYTLIAEVFAEPLNGRTGIDEGFWDGTIAMRFLQPWDLASQCAAGMAGRWAVGFLLFSAPLLLCAPLFGVDPAPASFACGVEFAVSLAIAILIGLAVDFFFSALMVRLELGVWMVGHVRSAVGGLVSGSLLPLALLPWGLGRVFEWLPFASMASTPLRIYTGTGPAAPLIAVQLLWAAVLCPAVTLFWDRTRERIVSLGG